MLDTATSATFKPHVGDRFEVTPQEGEPFEVVLSSCEETTYGSPGERAETAQRVPFSLVFVGPAEHAVNQQICAFSHPELGAFDLFIVPVARVEAGVSYEAVFN